MADLTKTILNTSTNAFKNSNIYTGSFTISGTTSPGLNSKTFQITLNAAPDLTDVQFNGPTAFGAGVDARPAGGWFKSGAIWVRGDDGGAGYTNEPTSWRVYTAVNGTIMTVTLVYSQQFIANLVLTSTTFYYRVVDYSVF